MRNKEKKYFYLCFGTRKPAEPWIIDPRKFKKDARKKQNHPLPIRTKSIRFKALHRESTSVLLGAALSANSQNEKNLRFLGTERGPGK